MDMSDKLVYGVWIDGQGWLRDNSGRIFADMRRAYAEEAARFITDRCRVALFDNSMLALEPLFLDQEKRRKEMITANNWENKP